MYITEVLIFLSNSWNTRYVVKTIAQNIYANVIILAHQWGEVDTVTIVIFMKI